MNEPPEFLRTEVWHPMTVHFPIVLLIVATLFKGIAVTFRKQTFAISGSVLLYLGVIGAWLAVYTGTLADAVVSRDICDPTVLSTHENNAWLATWLFTGAMGVDLLYSLVRRFRTRAVQALLLVVLVIGSGVLAYVGHLGAQLVYQQAAGVYVPSEDCSEFR
ncbi:MAG: DUF2231 domain-containing protein [candidate division KSB1 bacterium]|nr:DUF2231 domain-containing protein [candidate division KSB1 bacterium]